MRANYPGAIVVEAAQYGYATKNRPKRWGFHTPEEPADTHPSTPEYLAVTDRDASYTYFVSYLAFVFQLVPESEGAYAHGLDGKPEPSWSDGTNLNLQSFSLSFEGYAATIHRTMPRGSPQWNAAVKLVAHRTKALGLNLDESFQHKDVSIYRADCGQWDQAAFIADVKAEMEDDMDKAEVQRIVKEMLFVAQLPGSAATNEYTLEHWLGSYHAHRSDAAKHSAGEAHDHEIPAGRTGEA